MGKILIVTGKKAEKIIRNYLNSTGAGKDADIFAADTDVASFLTPEKIVNELKKIDLSCYKAIIVPGGARGDMRSITDAFGIKCVKGPTQIQSLGVLLDDKKIISNLSSVHPADRVIKNAARREAENEIAEAYAVRGSKKSRIKIGKLPVGEDYPMYVIAEITDASKYNVKELENIAGYFAKSGARIIDLGMTTIETDKERIKRMIECVKSLDVPVSIDSLNPDEIVAAVKAGADLVLSIDESNWREVDKRLDGKEKNRASFVLIPRNENGKIPKSPEERTEVLERLMKIVPFEKFIVDPVLEPINHNFTDSIAAYRMFRMKHPGVPMMMGVGNITEMTDADSIGMNMVLAGIASELDIDLLFTTEHSGKTAGSVRELVTASEMMYIAKKRRTSPKDLGADLIVLKEKKRTKDEVEGEDMIMAAEHADLTDFSRDLDDLRARIFLTENAGGIKVVISDKNKRIKAFEGRSARDLYLKILRTFGGRISLEHAAYLGDEMRKAETAVRIGRNYVQDTDLF